MWGLSSHSPRGHQVEFLPLDSSLYWSGLVYTGQYWFILINTGLYRPVLVCTGTQQRMPPHVGTQQPPPTPKETEGH